MGNCCLFQGIAELKADLLNVALKQSYMGESIPQAWLSFEASYHQVQDLRHVLHARSSCGLASFSTSYRTLFWERRRSKHSVLDDVRFVRKLAVNSGLFDSSEIHRAISFLHDLGSLQHFTSHFLKSRVVIDPQWIVDVMARVVNVKESVIQAGKLRHSDVATVWSEYPSDLHEWLLRLTEEFDLTFPLADKSLNLVPCLLPENPPPDFEWPDPRKGEREAKMVYKFHYLPLGLFNRVQVTFCPSHIVRV